MSLKSGWHREWDRRLRRLGYRPSHTDSHGHLVYLDSTGRRFSVPSSPSDWRTQRIMLTQLRAAHPDVLARRRSARAARARNARGRAARVVVALVPAVRVRVPTPPRTECVSCGRPWLSDLDPLQHACPRCGGEHRIGLERAG